MQIDIPTRQDVLTRRLANFAALTAAEEALVRQLSSGPEHVLGAHRDLVREGDVPRAAYLITSGWASRYRMLEDGRRQILAFLIPGDLSDANSAVLARRDHSIGALTPISYVEIAYDRLKQMMSDHLLLGRALSCQMLADLSIQREWTMNLGRRTALERIGHLLCEMMERLKAVGLARGTGCDIPITQNDISEATGLTAVHVNRTLQEMRTRGLIMLKGKLLNIPDPEGLKRIAFFNPSYLHHRAAPAPASAFRMG